LPGAGDLDVNSEAGAVHDDLVLEALVDQGFADGAASVLGDPVQQGDARGVGLRQSPGPDPVWTGTLGVFTAWLTGLSRRSTPN
jgi:hypothetical protein